MFPLQIQPINVTLKNNRCLFLASSKPINATYVYNTELLNIEELITNLLTVYFDELMIFLFKYLLKTVTSLGNLREREENLTESRINCGRCSVLRLFESVARHRKGG